MNNKAQFTPGPWRKGIDNTIYQSKTNKRIADVYMHMIYRDSDAQAQANATLIAAAPAMYEALAKLRLEAIHYRNTGVGKQFLNEAIAQAEQAINQVWGEGNHDTKREG